MGYYLKLASAIYNDIVSGLKGYTSTSTISLEQLEDEVVNERLQVIKEYVLKGLLPKKDLLISINCIPIDCKDIENCTCKNVVEGTPTMHFEIPQILSEYDQGIEYIGSTDKQIPFIWYTDVNSFLYHKYRKRGKDKPYIFIDTTPNSNNMFDCWVFNAPLLKSVTVIGVFKDLRQLENYGCCYDIDNISFIDTEIKRRLIEKKLRYYKQLATNIMPNDQAPH